MTQNLTIAMVVELITPELAQAYLTKNSGNRNIRPRVVARLARSMTAGRWTLTGEAIKFDRNGRLIDGQHRLSAIVQAGVAVEIVVMRGLLRRERIARPCTPLEREPSRPSARGVLSPGSNPGWGAKGRFDSGSLTEVWGEERRVRVPRCGTGSRMVRVAHVTRPSDACLIAARQSQNSPARLAHDTGCYRSIVTNGPAWANGQGR